MTRPAAAQVYLIRVAFLTWIEEMTDQIATFATGPKIRAAKTQAHRHIRAWKNDIESTTIS